MTRARSITMGISRVLALAVAIVTGPACGGSSPPVAPTASAKAPIPLPRFDYQALDGRTISSESLANRVSVIGFLTTYDVHSQAEARVLLQIEQHHSPRVNVGALVLEAPENAPLVKAFAASMRLGFPVAMADAATIAGEGPFAGLHHVPSVVVLDRAGQEAWRHVGFVTEAQLDAALRSVEAASPPPREVQP